MLLYRVFINQNQTVEEMNNKLWISSFFHSMQQHKIWHIKTATVHHIPHSTRNVSLVSSTVVRGHLPLSLYLYFSQTLIAVLVRSVKYWMLAWPSIAGWPKLSMMRRISCTALLTIAGSAAQVWKMLPATDFARASDVIALYSQWLTTRNHVPNSSATNCCVATGSEAIMLQTQLPISLTSTAIANNKHCFCDIKRVSLTVLLCVIYTCAESDNYLPNFASKNVRLARVVNISVLILLPIVSAILYEYWCKYRWYLQSAVSKWLSAILFSRFFGNSWYQ